MNPNNNNGITVYLSDPVQFEWSLDFTNAPTDLNRNTIQFEVASYNSSLTQINIVKISNVQFVDTNNSTRRAYSWTTIANTLGISTIGTFYFTIKSINQSLTKTTTLDKNTSPKITYIEESPTPKPTIPTNFKVMTA
jgi:hypothetical protein